MAASNAGAAAAGASRSGSIEALLDAPKFAYYGDDFTGATDTLATAARAGLEARLFLRPPSDAQLARTGALDCLGIAGAARAMSPAQMQAELAPVREFFARLSAPIVHYKVCSTFDSAPEVGNIGTAIAALRELAPNPLVAVVGGQPNLGRWCVFGNLFAAFGAGGPVHRIDRHPTMSRHPVTPMHEADLRRHLALQGLATIGSLDYTTYALGREAIARAVDAQLAQHPDAVLFDVAREEELAAVGEVLWARAQQARLLAVGASSVLRAVIAHWRRSGAMSAAVDSNDALSAALPASGPVLALAGSLSPVTARQVAAARSFRRVPVDARRLIREGDDHLSKVAIDAARLLDAGAHVLVVTAPENAAADTTMASAVAAASTRLVHEVLGRAKVGRLGIAGGDTSSHAVLASGAWALSHFAQLADDISLCRLHAGDARVDGLEVMLKGGQIGPIDVFERLVHGAAGRAA